MFAVQFCTRNIQLKRKKGQLVFGENIGSQSQWDRIGIFGFIVMFKNFLDSSFLIHNYLEVNSMKFNLTQFHIRVPVSEPESRALGDLSNACIMFVSWPKPVNRVGYKSKLIVNLINKSSLPPYAQMSCVFMALHYCWSSFPFNREESYPSYWLG